MSVESIRIVISTLHQITTRIGDLNNLDGSMHTFMESLEKILTLKNKIHILSKQFIGRSPSWEDPIETSSFYWEEKKIKKLITIPFGKQLTQIFKNFLKLIAYIILFTFDLSLFVFRLYLFKQGQPFTYCFPVKNNRLTLSQKILQKLQNYIYPDKGKGEDFIPSHTPYSYHNLYDGGERESLSKIEKISSKHHTFNKNHKDIELHTYAIAILKTSWFQAGRLLLSQTDLSQDGLFQTSSVYYTRYPENF